MTIDIDILVGHGVYTLLLHVKKEVAVTVGNLGKQRFPAGTYSYTGSALGKGARLKNRISRHLRKEKRCFWHIDYLLENENVCVEAVVAAETSQKMECEVNQHIKTELGAKVQVKGFGASDCRKGCSSHLLYVQDAEDVKLLVQNLVEYLSSVSGVVSVYETR